MPVFAALLASTLAAACGKEDPAPVELRLTDLVRFPQSYDGMRVIVTGTVRCFPDPPHCWIEDNDLNRVEIRPRSAVSGLASSTVRVAGKFQYSDGRGRSIEAASAAAIEGS